nr:MAG TPA: hypothetical protein [Caudoviricetes sp.]
MLTANHAHHGEAREPVDPAVIFSLLPKWHHGSSFTGKSGEPQRSRHDFDLRAQDRQGTVG